MHVMWIVGDNDRDLDMIGPAVLRILRAGDTWQSDRPGHDQTRRVLSEHDRHEKAIDAEADAMRLDAIRSAIKVNRPFIDMGARTPRHDTWNFRMGNFKRHTKGWENDGDVRGIED